MSQFLRYYEGAMPNKKPAKTPQERKATQKKYEAERTREFKEKWRTGACLFNVK